MKSFGVGFFLLLFCFFALKEVWKLVVELEKSWVNFYGLFIYSTFNKYLLFTDPTDN